MDTPYDYIRIRDLRSIQQNDKKVTDETTRAITQNAE